LYVIPEMPVNVIVLAVPSDASMMIDWCAAVTVAALGIVVSVRLTLTSPLPGTAEALLFFVKTALAVPLPVPLLLCATSKVAVASTVVPAPIEGTLIIAR